MDDETLAQNIIDLSRRDMWDNVGRVFLKDICTRFQVQPEQVITAIHLIKRNHETKMPNENTLLITLIPRPKRRPIFKLPRGVGIQHTK